MIFIHVIKFVPRETFNNCEFVHADFSHFKSHNLVDQVSLRGSDFRLWFPPWCFSAQIRTWWSWSATVPRQREVACSNSKIFRRGAEKFSRRSAASTPIRASTTSSKTPSTTLTTQSQRFRRRRVSRCRRPSTATRRPSCCPRNGSSGRQSQFESLLPS